MEGVIPEGEGEGNERFKLTAADDKLFSELHNDKDFQQQREEIKLEDAVEDPTAEQTR